MRYYNAMGAPIAIIICGFLTLLLQGLHHTYFALPRNERKRHAKRGKKHHQQISQVADYEVTAHVFFTVLIFIFAAATVITISRAFEPLSALLILLGATIVYKVAGKREFGFFRNLASQLAPFFAALLGIIDPLVKAVANIIEYRWHARRTTSIYDLEDLKDLLETQRTAPNNRIDPNALDNVLRSLEFNDRKIKQVMTHWNSIHFVTPKDPIGPILLSELHKSGFTYFPVKGNGENEVVGMLHIEALASHPDGGAVAEAMDKKVLYVRDDAPLTQVAQAIFKTGHQVFMVVNHEQKIVGLVTAVDLLKAILGDSIEASFEDFDDPTAVADDKSVENEQ